MHKTWRQFGMFDMDYVSTEVQGILSMLDANSFPNVFGYLASLQDEYSVVSTSPFAIANNVIGLDKPHQFLDFLIDFITDMFELEIADGNDHAMNDLGAFDSHLISLY